MITLTGAELTPAQLVAIVDDGESVEIAPAARAGAAAARVTVADVLTRRPVYGRTTGVGANNSVTTPGDGADGLRLLRSHAGGAGDLVSGRMARAALVVRANQLLAAGSGLDPAIIDALVAAINAGAYPQLHELGGIGTGDLTAMAELALTLIGERDWVGSPQPAITIESVDALALLSSSALTIAQAALAYAELARLADAATVVAALTFTALRSSPEPFAAEVQAARPHAGAVAVAARMRGLTEPVGATSGRIHDPYGLRALAPVHGVLIEALDRLRAVLVIEANAAAENPLVSTSASDVFHHGNFHQAPLAAALDGLRLALVSSAQLSTARLSALMEPRLTGLTPFLAEGPDGSSGLMVIDYTAASALAALRALATAVTTGNAVLSRGVEDHASFAPQAARQTISGISAYRIVVSAELVAAVRALRLAVVAPQSAELGATFDAAASALPTATGDRPLDGDLHIAASFLNSIGRAHEL